MDSFSVYEDKISFFHKNGKLHKIRTINHDHTIFVAGELGKILKKGDIVCLDGDLGAGKTVFISGIAKAAGIKGVIPSPTFTILIEHENAEIPFYHFDVYRLGNEEEFYDLGFDEYLYGKGICAVEWASRIPGVFPGNSIQVFMFREDYDNSEYRQILFYFPENDKRFELFTERIKNYDNPCK